MTAIRAASATSAQGRACSASGSARPATCCVTAAAGTAARAASCHPSAATGTSTWTSSPRLTSLTRCWPAGKLSRMRIGFLKTLLYSRYGDFWLALARDAGAEPVFADPEDVLRHNAGNLAAEVPASGFRLATAEALALAHCDIIVVPGLNYGLESTRGGGQDPWVSDFPEALAATSGLRNIFAVPAWLDPSMTDLVVTFLQ